MLDDVVKKSVCIRLTEGELREVGKACVIDAR